ncbi:branched-chain amino acid ABC transporter substrate-binding protein [Thermococcus paralvinellae]|uniref:Uncharacterized protein n=1 Tax=Thermococcus paralvinellae TaxID=582419 RepID=W0I1Z1_9EURY|nr:branched-chain amino acid ABC transporter substrate-binding protein [Thermococcus paralvinellae]AHF80029.1 Hypothetical protein TES1_0641 [Thermococcus paralvinellae]
MMLKKTLALLFGFLILASAVPLSRAQTETTTSLNLVILVSDNEADYALAQKVAEYLNASIIVTPWGVYDPNVTSQIVARAPDLVLIIGGPAAVSEEYENDLQDLGIPYVRRWGANRYETNLAVLQYLFENYSELLKNVKVVIVYGEDITAIRKAENITGRAIIIYVDEDYLENQTQILQLLNATTVLIINTPYSENITERVRERVREKIKANVTYENTTITAEDALLAIQIAENKTMLAESLVANISIPAAEKLLENAKEHLEEAKEAYNETKYGRAYGLAIAAKSIAEVVIRMASEEKQIMLHNNETMKIEIKLEKLEDIVERLEELGFNVTEEKALLEQAEQAYENGDYALAKQLLEQLKELIRTKYHNEKELIRARWEEKEKHHREDKEHKEKNCHGECHHEDENEKEEEENS